MGNIINGRDPQTYCSDDLQIRPTWSVALTLMPWSSASHRGRPITQRVLKNKHRACWSGSVVAQVTWPHRREPQPNPLNIHELIALPLYHIPPCFLRFGHQIFPNPSKPGWKKWFPFIDFPVVLGPTTTSESLTTLACLSQIYFTFEMGPAMKRTLSKL